MSTATITPKQQSLIRRLLVERASSLGITDVDAFIKDKGVDSLTITDASAFIEKVKSYPVPPLAGTEHLPEGRAIKNRYSKPCTLCGHEVAPDEGFAVQTSEGWLTYHAKDACPQGGAVTEERISIQPKRSYVLDDGTIIVAYTTQNGYLAVRRLVVEDGSASLEYWKGGLAIAKRTVARALTQEEAGRLGKTHGICCVCARPLTDDRSLFVGYGPECAGNNGWWYPTHKEVPRQVISV